MSQLYQDYVWKEGIPYGILPIEEGDGVKVIADPYRKRISIERYQGDTFKETIYDSIFLDYRHLKTADQNAWERKILEEADDTMLCLIKNQDDRVLFREFYNYENGICRSCKITSPHGILLSTHRMYYTALHDRFDGVILFDPNEYPVMLKKYICDLNTQEFIELVEENWTLTKDLLKQNFSCSL